MKLNHKTTINTSARHGFSLIELMIVIVIIGILMALVLPAIGGARRAARITQVSTEITQLDQAITSFKARFGVEPPSSLNIPISQAGWTAEDRQKVLRVWDQFDFAICGGYGATAVPPFAGGYPATELHLNGAECLVFFLGGLNNGTSTTPVMIGFSKNPRTPWSPLGENRDAPFYDRIVPGRVADIDGDGIIEFLDSLPDQTAPILYFSSQGKSYRKLNGSGWDDFDIHTSLIEPANPHPKDLSSLYLGSDSKTPERAQGYQIISPGSDGLYGIGGKYTDGSELTGLRAAEADNITNFSGGEMKK